MSTMTAIFVPEPNHRFTHRMCCQCHRVWNHNTVPPACRHPPCPGCTWGRDRVVAPFDPGRKPPRDWKCACGVVHDIDMLLWGVIGWCCEEPRLEDIYDDEGRDYFRGYGEGDVSFGRDLGSAGDLVRIQKWLYTFEEIWEEHVDVLNWMYGRGHPLRVRERELSVRDLLRLSADPEPL